MAHEKGRNGGVSGEACGRPAGRWPRSWPASSRRLREGCGRYGERDKTTGARRVLRHRRGFRTLATLASLGVAAFLLGAAPSFWPAVGVSACLYGAGVMLMSALLSVWSSAVFPEQPSTGFSAALFVFGVGSTAGPVALGALAGSFGLEAAFLATAVLTLLTMLVRPKGGTRLDAAKPFPERASNDLRRCEHKAD